MQITSRFTIAIHALTAIAVFGDSMTVSSSVIASSANVNPVIIRRIMLQLSDAGMIDVKRGRGGIRLAKEPKDISFLDVFYAVEALDKGELFHFHEEPNKLCPVGRNIHIALDDKLSEIQSAMENEMKKLTIADVVNTTAELINRENK